MKLGQAYREISKTVILGTAFFLVAFGLGQLLGLAGLDARSAVAGILTWTIVWLVVGGVFGLKVEVEKWVFKGRQPRDDLEAVDA